MSRKKRRQPKGRKGQKAKVKVKDAKSKPSEESQTQTRPENEEAAVLTECGWETAEACNDDLEGGDYGVLGLVNLRNTCYFNSVVQTLVSSRELQAHFAAMVKVKRGGPLTEALKEIFALARQKHSSKKTAKSRAFRPNRLLDAVGKACPTFKGRHQHDCHELLVMMIHKLLDEEVETLPRDSSTTSQERRQSTFVAKAFRGNFMGTISCNKCGFVKSDKEEFFEISVPIVRPVTAAQNSQSTDLPEGTSSPSQPQCEIREAVVGPVVERTDENCLMNLRGNAESTEMENSSEGDGGNSGTEPERCGALVQTVEDDVGSQNQSKLENGDVKMEGDVECHEVIKGGGSGTDMESPEEAPCQQSQESNCSDEGDDGGGGESGKGTSEENHSDILLSGPSEISEVKEDKREDESDDSEGMCLLDLFHMDEPEYEEVVDEIESDNEPDEEGFTKVTHKKKKGKRSSPKVYSSYGAMMLEKEEADKTETIKTIDECLDAYFCPENVHWKCPVEFPERRIKFTEEKPEVFIIPKGDPCRFMTDCPAVSMFGLNSGFPPCADEEDEDENLVEEGDEGYIKETWTDIFPLKTTEGVKSCLKKNTKKPKPPPKPVDESLNSIKKYKIWLTPNVLNVHLKRFEVNARGRLRKLNQHVSFGLELDLSRVCDSGSPDIDRSRYHLRGVICHSGSIAGGHYIAYVLRDRGERKWYYVSDNEVQVVSEAKVLASQAYILTYERHDPTEPPCETDNEETQTEAAEPQTCPVKSEGEAAGEEPLECDVEIEGGSNISSDDVLILGDIPDQSVESNADVITKTDGESDDQV
ncbi:hypothetical protein BSKO_01864 [Bryopsis sp. KO-2023]|nr:hypothetical protein BSKO_01864 [Bryopsis sp. KO-2023]